MQFLPLEHIATAMSSAHLFRRRGKTALLKSQVKTIYGAHEARRFVFRQGVPIQHQSLSVCSASVFICSCVFSNPIQHQSVSVAVCSATPFSISLYLRFQQPHLASVCFCVFSSPIQHHSVPERSAADQQSVTCLA